MDHTTTTAPRSEHPVECSVTIQIRDLYMPNWHPLFDPTTIAHHQVKCKGQSDTTSSSQVPSGKTFSLLLPRRLIGKESQGRQIEVEELSHTSEEALAPAVEHIGLAISPIHISISSLRGYESQEH